MQYQTLQENLLKDQYQWAKMTKTKNYNNNHDQVARNKTSLCVPPLKCLLQPQEATFSLFSPLYVKHSLTNTVQ